MLCWKTTISATALVAAIALAGCGGGSGGSSSSPSGSGSSGAKVPSFAANYTPPSSGCGHFDAPMPADPDGVIAALPKEQQSKLGGYTDFPNSTIKVLKSAWSDWKPDHAKPFTVAISWGQLVSDFQVQTYQNLQDDLKQSPLVGSVVARTTGSNLDVAQQLQQYDSLVQQQPDLIILESPSPDSFIGPVDKAAAQGIPTVTMITPVPSANAVNVDSNNFLAAGITSSYAARVRNGKGNVMLVHAIAGVPVDLQATEAFKEVIASCPGMKLVGEVYGGFSDAQATGEVLKFLATHPQPVDFAFEIAGMAPGVMRAFQQSGRPMPLVPDVGLSKGSLGYWREHDADYDSAGAGLVPVATAGAAVEVALRMLAGQGVKMNTIVGGADPLVTDANLDDWAQPDWTLQTQGVAPGKRDDFLPSSFLDAFFTHPAPVGQ